MVDREEFEEAVENTIKLIKDLNEFYIDITATEGQIYENAKSIARQLVILELIIGAYTNVYKNN